MLDHATEKTPRIEDMELISEYLVDDIRERATSDHIEHEDVHIGSPPSRTYFAGSLSPSEGDFEEQEDDIYSRVSPSALHMFVQVVPDSPGATIEIEPEFDIFYRIFPRWEDADIESEQSVFRKLVPDVDPVELELPGTDPDPAELESRIDTVKNRLEENIDAALRSLRSEIKSDPLQYSSGSNGEQLLEDFFAGEFESPEAYRQHAAEANLETELPELEVTVNIRALEADEVPIQLKFSLENRSDETMSDTVEHTIFNAGLQISEVSNTSFEPFRFTRLPEDYRYDRELVGYGVNCSVEQADAPDRTVLQTTCLPVHEQHRYRHHKPNNEAAEPTFEKLAEDPVPALRALKSEMEAYRDTIWKEKISQLEDEYSGKIASEARKQLAEFENEIERFDAGIQVLSEYEMVEWAFKLMNETFDRKVLQEDGSRTYDSWRLFQIVFIVSNIPDIARRELPGVDASPEEVSLLWFPTGGGKTEAYLGLVVMGMHFDRLRDKNLGLTSMMRYPLRLLSLQQFQRITELFMYADEVRKERNLGGESYSVGYLTGGTENKLRDLVEKEFNTNLNAYETRENIAQAEELAERWNDGSLHNVSAEEYQFVNSCPICGSDVTIQFNIDSLTVDHRCTGETCDWDRLPVHVVDNELYRLLPTMVVGTQDKLAALGYERKFRLLLGHVDSRCPEHGFTDGTECTEKYFCGLDTDEHEKLYPKDPVPALQIQDELHLVKEELGTFESHYWSAMEKIIEWSGYEKPKLIAATATIEAYKNQIEHLYQREGTLFPAPGPEYRQSFYASADLEETQRYFLGITPWNRSHINSVVSIIEAQQKAVQDLGDNLATQDDIELTDFQTAETQEEVTELLRFYQTAVNYVISKKEGARVYTSVETQINEDLKRDGYDEMQRMSLTGDSSFQAVSDMLDRFEAVPDDPAAISETEDLVIATSTISHGVDLDALNFMLFFGMPRRTAEYIQSSSRVGRKYPGIVVDCFHPIRERDRSHFHYFGKYHEYQDWLVEPVPVNRWAKFSVKRTVPGLFMALILQKRYDELYHEFGSPYLTSTIAQAHAKGAISEEELVEDLCEIYGTDSQDSPVFREEIERKVTQFMSAIDNKQKNFVSDSLPGDHGAMFSLRDVDQSVDIFTTKDDGRIVENLADKSGSENQ